MQTPLIVRLRDLPDLGHGVRATLAVQRLRHVATAQLRCEARDTQEQDRLEATDRLYGMHGDGERIEEFVSTVVTPLSAFLATVEAAGLLIGPRRAPRRFRLLRGGR